MAKKISQKRMIAFNKKVSDLVERQFDATLIHQREDGAKSWSLQTKAGELRISVHSPEPSHCFSIFTCFEDVKKANEIVKEVGLDDHLNPYSGKWNYHLSNETDCLAYFEGSLNKIV